MDPSFSFLRTKAEFSVKKDTFLEDVERDVSGKTCWLETCSLYRVGEAINLTKVQVTTCPLPTSSLSESFCPQELNFFTEYLTSAAVLFSTIELYFHLICIPQMYFFYLCLKWKCGAWLVLFCGFRCIFFNSWVKWFKSCKISMEINVLSLFLLSLVIWLSLKSHSSPSVCGCICGCAGQTIFLATILPSYQHALEVSHFTK